MSLSSDDTPTGPIAGTRQAPAGAPGTGSRAQPVAEPTAPEQLTKRRNAIRDLTAVALLLLAPLFPWNLYFGLGIPGSHGVLWGVLAVVTLLSLLAVAVSRARIDPATLIRLRPSLNIPYLLLVVAFVLFDVFESIKFGGQVRVPGGLGPGGWLGFAGALLSAQPVLAGPVTDEAGYDRPLRAARMIGYISMFGASLSAGFNLCWRLRYALQGIDGSETFGTRNIAVIVTALVYGAVALTAVLVASRWILRNTNGSRLATVALGTSSLLAGIIVWSLPVGREIDAFHGIAQNTSTAGVGYEGFLAWAGAAALFLPLALFSSAQTRADRELWRTAIRKGLTLVIVWCLGSMLMRFTDLAVAAMLNYPYSRYDTMTLAVFDLTTGVLAWWLRSKLSSGPLRSRQLVWSSGLVFTLTVSRVVLGVVLAPRFEQVAVNPVYGNDLAQQIDSTFDVTLCWLALFIFVAVIVAGRLRKPRRRPRRQGQPSTAGPSKPSGPGRPPTPIPTRPGMPPPPSEARTTQFGAARSGHDAPTSVLSGPSRSPRIFRPGPESTPGRAPERTPDRAPERAPERASERAGAPRPRIYRPPNNPT